MKAYLFSIGESTTDLAHWSLKRLGLEVVLLQDPATTLWDKYVEFLQRAQHEAGPVVRWDADVIALPALTEMIKRFQAQDMHWWWSGSGYCHLRHDLVPVSGQVMRPEVIRLGLEHMHEFRSHSRPETSLSRVPGMYNPRRFTVVPDFVGIHAWRQTPADIGRVMQQKADRGQVGWWDNERIKRMEEL